MIKELTFTLAMLLPHCHRVKEAKNPISCVASFPRVPLSESIKRLVCEEAKAQSVPASLIFQVIGHESLNNPNATRFEPREYERLLSDPQYARQARQLSTSYGLMQVMGYHYSSRPTALLSPTINIRVGTSVLASALTECRSIQSALTKYNTGRCGQTAYAQLVLKVPYM
jgi:soluble lytic murein transglycosylase-like protein